MASRIVVERSTDKAVTRLVQKGLIAHNRKSVGAARWRRFVLSAREGRRVVGGLTGVIAWNEAFVAMLWVDEAARGQGHGSRLMQAAARFARLRRCALIYLNTFSFQAPRFYEKLGYRRFGALKGVPARDASRIFYVKRLSGARA